jgi:hypothetical protein
MNGFLGLEEELQIGRPVLLDSCSSENSFAVFFEDDGDTGYFYALDTKQEPSILDAVHIYNVKNIVDRDVPSNLQIAWSVDGLKAALIINDYVHAVFDFDANRGYCRTGFPPMTDWSKEGHHWNDEALGLFI